MKILLTIHHFLDPNAGASGATLQLGEAYRNLGHEVYFYSYDNLPSHLPGRLMGLLFPFYVAYYIYFLHQKEHLDVVHASSIDAWIWGCLFQPINRRNRPLLVTQSHGLEHTMHQQILAEAQQGNLRLSWKYPLYNGSVLLWQAATSFRIADLCFMLNRHDAQMLIQQIGLKAAKIKVFPNGIPTKFLGLPFQELQLPPGELPQIACVGSYINRKGIQYSVPALHQLMHKYPKLKVSFLGTGCAASTVLNDFPTALQARIKVISHFDKQDLPLLLTGHHILLFPSLSEGFPLALVEAMACGLAPVVTEIPGCTEVVTDRQNGLLIPPRQPAAITQALTQLLENPQQLNQLRREAYESVQQYSWESIAQQHFKLYTQTLGKDHPILTMTLPNI
jgi:glycosyltransferase involved in cell wall biosynthesis